MVGNGPWRETHEPGYFSAKTPPPFPDSLVDRTGCAPQVGDACVSNLDCGSQVQCDQSQPGGYCTVSGCIPGSCPDESTCVEFETGETWCMAMCKTAEDCRAGYECRKGSVRIHSVVLRNHTHEMERGPQSGIRTSRRPDNNRVHGISLA